MRNYLRSELYRNFKRMYFKAITIGTLILAAVGCLIFLYIGHVYPQKVDVSVLLFVGMNLLGTATTVMFVFADMITAEENKNNTLKNIISSGLSRPKIYLTKLIVSIIMMICYVMIVFFGSVAIGYLILGIGDTSEFLRLFSSLGLRMILAAIPLWMGAIAIATLLAMFINRGSIFVCTYIGIFSITGTIFYYLGVYINPIFETARQYLISTQMGKLMKDIAFSNNELLQVGGVGIIYVIVFAIIGVLLMQKKNA